MAEVKPRSFRIDEETAEKFKKICLEAGLNQQEALAKLIESYELQAGKAVLTEKREDIEVFERYTSLLVQKYMGALEEIQDSRETIRSEFKSQLDSKDTLICDLQLQKKAAEEAMKQATADATKASQEAEKLRKDLETEQEKCSELKESLTDKDQLNKALKADKDRLEAEVKALKEAQQQLAALRQELEEAKAAKAAAEKLLESEREKMQFSLDKTLLEAAQKHQTEIQALKEAKQQAIDDYQKKYLELLDQLRKPEEVTKEK